MTRLERRPWIDGFVIAGYGTRVGIRANVPALLDQLRFRLPPGARPAKDGVVDRVLSVWCPVADACPHRRDYYVVYADHVRVGRSAELETALDSFDSHLRIALAQYARPNLFVHAGAVSWNGRGILIPGKSLSGKTHLVAELLRNGATYYSDEYAVLDPDGRLHAFAKPLSIRAHRAARQRDVPVADLGGTVGSRPVSVGLIALCAYEPGARWKPEALSPGAGLLGLLANSFSARERPGQAIDILGRVVRDARILSGRRGDASEAALRILDAIDNPGVHANV